MPEIKELEEILESFRINFSDCGHKKCKCGQDLVTANEMEKWLTKAFEAGEKAMEKEFEEMATEAAHNTAQGWCCACSADIAFFEGRLKRGEKLSE